MTRKTNRPRTMTTPAGLKSDPMRIQAGSMPASLTPDDWKSHSILMNSRTFHCSMTTLAGLRRSG